MPYAVYRYLMNTTGTGDHSKWGSRSRVTMEQLKELASPDSLHFDHIGVTYFTQFHLHLQVSIFLVEWTLENGEYSC